MQNPKRRPESGLRRRVLAAGLWFLQEFTYRGRTIVVAALLLAGLSVGGTLAWQKWSPAIAGRERYLVTADRIQISPPPAWLQKNVAAEAIEEAGLASGLSLLDAELVPRLVAALELHPWIHRVRRIEKRYPASILAEVDYRVPLAAVLVASGGARGTGASPDLHPIDEHGIHLPAADVPQTMLVRLPRIDEVGPLPLVGQPLEDAKSTGAVALVRQLREVWDRLHLVSVVPVDRPEIRSEEKYYLYDLITKGGTLIHWGAAPDAAPPDEASPAEKLARLRRHISQHGPLDTIDAPRVINVRQDAEAVPHVADRQ